MNAMNGWMDSLEIFDEQTKVTYWIDKQVYEKREKKDVWFVSPSDGHTA